MAGRVCALILAVCAARGSAGDLSSPTNVQLSSHNMELVLRWGPPAGAAGGLLYTVELSNTGLSYREVCVNTSALQCDLTSPHLSVYGNYTGRVRALQGGSRSPWAESNHVTMDRDTTIGPPSVTLLPLGVSLEVDIKEPAFKISSLREVYSFSTYNIFYWKSGQEDTITNLTGIGQNRVVLQDLEARTRYCVQVQINTKRNRLSEFSRIVCERTINEETPPWVAAVVAFVVMAVVVVLVVVMVLYWKQISQFLCPEATLPPNFKEALLPPPKSSVYLAWPLSEEVFHPVSIVAYNRTEKEEGCPLEEGGSNKEPDATEDATDTRRDEGH